jgi:hypothetical protein
MSSTIKLRIGPIELECSASEEFLKEELPTLFASMATMYREHFVTSEDGPNEANQPKTDEKPSVDDPMSVASIAARLKVESGPDLIVAACISLSRLGKSTFSRKEITDEMKKASSYYKKTYLNNLTSYLQSLVSSTKLLEQTTGVYALQAKCKSELEARLAQP